MKDIYYINSAGVELDLLTPPYMLQTGELFDYEWGYESSYTSLTGGKIEYFKKDIEEILLTLSIINYGQESYYAAIDKFYETTDFDVMNKKPGKLCFGDYYLPCYLIASKKTEWESDSSFLDNAVTLVVEYPFWLSERKYSFYKNASDISDDNIGQEYPYEYPYEYAGVFNVQYLLNAHFTSCGFRMIWYGPCVNPQVRIGDHLYEVKTTLYDGEYLVIDTTNRTVKKIKNSGEEENLFNSRNHDSYLWEKIPCGKHTVNWPGTFGIDIILLFERSEPPWNS